MVSASDCLIKTKVLNMKKVSKPLMEKKRRARINKCLEQLKSLLENCYSNNIRKRKLEKADILELTVKYLRHLQRVQRGPSVMSGFADYQAGFRSCLTNVHQYLLMDDSCAGRSSNTLVHLSRGLLSLEGRVPVSSTMDSEGSAPTQDAAKQRLSEATVSEMSAVCPINCAKLPQNRTKNNDIVSGPTENSLTQHPHVSATAVNNKQENRLHNERYPRNQGVTVNHCRNESVTVMQCNYWRPW